MVSTGTKIRSADMAIDSNKASSEKISYILHISAQSKLLRRSSSLL